MPSRKPESEVEIGRVVVEALRARGWTVYQEVQSRLGPVADIVAVQGPVLWVVELKRQFGFDVLEQAHGWRGHANLRSIAIPNGLVYSPFRLHVASELGIGVLRVHGPWNGTEVSDPLYELVKPARERRVSKALRGQLRIERRRALRARRAAAAGRRDQLSRAGPDDVDNSTTSCRSGRAPAWGARPSSVR